MFSRWSPWGRWRSRRSTWSSSPGYPPQRTTERPPAVSSVAPACATISWSTVRGEACVTRKSTRTSPQASESTTAADASPRTESTCGSGMSTASKSNRASSPPETTQPTMTSPALPWVYVSASESATDCSTVRTDTARNARVSSPATPTGSDLQQPDEHLLRDVARLIGIPDDPHRQTNNRPILLAVQDIERAAFPRGTLREQLRVASASVLRLAHTGPMPPPGRSCPTDRRTIGQRFQGWRSK